MQLNFKRLFLFSFLTFQLVSAQNTPDSTRVLNSDLKPAKVKTGYNFGALPAIGYNSDIGFRYGILGTIYDYGDGSNYPNYEQSLFLEWSRTTKGNGINRATFDTRTLIPDTRMIADLNYTTERALDFFGFNGYQAYYNPNFTADGQDDYVSRMYYAHARKVLRVTVDLHGISEQRKLNWLGGVGFFNTRIATVDVAGLNKGKIENLLPTDAKLLYDNYVDWKVIPQSEAGGGNILYLKAGGVYDTRDKETNPNRGLWTEAALLGATGIGNTKTSYLRALISHRQYIPLYRNRLTLAYRLSYQTTLAGKMPFYMLPYAMDSYSIVDGIGSNKTVRGVLRNRIAGEGMAFANIELRSRLVDFRLINQNFYIGLIGFMDGGMVTKKYSFDETQIPANEFYAFNYNREKPHLSAGLGLRIAMNENFVVAVDYGKALNKQDGTSGLYIGLGYLF
ncbi:MAG: Omp85 family outer membrane protein [Paludibacteraceae bacterium]